jgi:hypothetical protein
MSEFLKAYQNGTAGMEFLSPGFCCACEECRDNAGFCCEHSARAAQEKDGGGLDEGHFSWHSCDTCGSTLGGDRYAAHGRDKDGAIVHLSICSDCLMYMANGDEPEQWENGAENAEGVGDE